MDGEKETDNKTTGSAPLAAAAADWADLTHECLINILSRLSLKDRWQGVMRVCKAWHQSCQDPYLNSVLDIESHFDSPTELPRFWTPDFERRVDNMLRSVVVWSAGGLTEIRVRHCSDRSLTLVAKRYPFSWLASRTCEIGLRMLNNPEIEILYAGFGWIFLIKIEFLSFELCACSFFLFREF